jgi:hypothetical protein
VKSLLHTAAEATETIAYPDGKVTPVGKTYDTDTYPYTGGIYVAGTMIVP